MHNSTLYAVFESRHGAYGVLLQGSRILLSLKKSGPYKGLWGLPGGAIEFGETLEEALKRELLEETALAAAQLELLSIAILANMIIMVSGINFTT
jgi:8-oxo-dGTP diphosphatase